MQIGVVMMDGAQVGTVSWTQGDEQELDSFTPDLEGYVPQGRAAERPFEGGSHAHTPPRHGGGHAPAHSPRHHNDGPAPSHHPRSRAGGEGDLDPPSRSHAPSGQQFQASGGHPVHQGSAEVDQAIVEAARAHRLDPNTMRSVASIESSMNPGSNANRSTQYKGLYQIGRDEWRRFGSGNIYNAHDNAMAAGRMFDANRSQFRSKYGRDPTDTELYLMHQQGLGFYTRGAMTNIGGNPYPGMRGAQNHDSFESGWGREVARRKAEFAARNAEQAKAEPPKDVTFDPETMAP